MPNSTRRFFLIALLALLPAAATHAQTMPSGPAPILTPPAAPGPRLNNPRVFGVRPGAPFLYSIPAIGERPMSFAADGLPAGLTLDTATGRMTGAAPPTGDYPVLLHARNIHGEAARAFDIKAGEEIALTPPMGWNSWNCWGVHIDQGIILRCARALVKAGLDQHGWTYINIDDAWQGRRGGALNAIQPDPKRFPDLKTLSDEVHALGLKLGIYSTPWVTSYAGHVGGSSEDPDGKWEGPPALFNPNKKVLPYAIGKHHFFANDAKQWAAWGIDYLKYDWAPNELPETREMYEALRASGRDIVLSLSNNTTNSLFGVIGDLSKYANAWRIGTDIVDSWESIKGHGFHNDPWAPYSRPGHWNDPDMFEIGVNGGGKPKQLTPDEQYTHVSQWCLLSAPLLLGCDLDHLDAFTLGLLTNDEVLEINQDALGKQATQVAGQGNLVVCAKPLDDGSWAVGLFNLGEAPAPVAINWSSLQLGGPQRVRDLWRQKDLGVFPEKFEAPVAPHGVVLLKVAPTKS